MDELGPTLRRMRRDAGLAQRELAEKAGVHWTIVSKFETGQRTPPFRSDTADAFERISTVLGDTDGVLMRLAGFTPVPPQEVRPTFPQFIREEPTLTPRQAAAILHVYDAFQASA